MSFLQNNIPESCHDAFKRDATAQALACIYQGIIGPFLLYVARKDLHSSEFLLGLIAAAPCIGSVVALLYAHAMEGRHKMPFMIWPQSFGRASFILVLFITTPIPFAVLATIAQVLISLGGPPYAAIMKEIYPSEQRGIMMSYVRVVGITAMLIVTAVGGILLHALGYKTIFVIGALVGLSSSLVFGTIKTAPIPPEELASPPNPGYAIPEGFLRHTMERC